MACRVAAYGDRLLASQAKVVKGTPAHLCVLWGRVNILASLLRYEPNLVNLTAAEVMRTGQVRIIMF